jgi:hypothetical protein
LETLERQIKDTIGELEPYLRKVENQNLLKRLQSDLDQQRTLLTSIEEKENSIKALEEKIKKSRKGLLGSYGEIFKHYVEIKVELSKDKYKSISEDLELQVRLAFDSKRFAEQFEVLLDKRLDIHGELPFFGKDKQYQFAESNHLDNIDTIFDVLFSGGTNNVKLKSGITQEEAILKLLEDYFVLDFDLIQNGDAIIDMSPGKRGLVLLKLFLHLSNANDPILLDQPEDNLDNRTIYRELNDFIKDRKTKRQIIMVSHNANLVVSTDSEEVIVANQSGQQTDGENRQFRFEYVSGAVECQFDKPQEAGILYQKGIRDHICEILEGGEDAFRKRENKYGFR